MCNKSESIVNLAKALVGFNSEVKIIEKDSSNPHFKNRYASLDNIIDEVRPILTKHGLSIIQMPGGDGEKFSLTTMLLHESGEWIESDSLIMRPTKNDPQGIGSCTTYARRYGISAFLNLNTGEDDDGNAATHPQTKPVTVPYSGSREQAQSVGQQRLAQEQQKSNGNSMGKVFEILKELGWKATDANAFASKALGKEVKFPMKDYVKGNEWAVLEKALLSQKEPQHELMADSYELAMEEVPL